MEKSFGYYVVRFTISLIGVFGFIYGVTFLMARFAPDLAETILTGPAAFAAGFAVFILPPLQTGQSFFQHEARPMRRGEGWGLAAICALIFTAAIMGVTYLSIANDPQRAAELATALDDGVVVALIPMVLFAVLMMLIFRLFFWASIRGQMKRAARQGSAP